MENSFGGKWTVEKLNILSEYLAYYLRVLKNKNFKKIYIDAFAGSGNIFIKDVEDKIEGSVRIALNSEVTFDEYIFIEKNKDFYENLKTIIDTEYEHLADKIRVINNDCNVALKDICKNINMQKDRAVLFIDPFATEFEWETLEMVSKTKVIDVWYLFPFSAAVRMMKNDGKIYEKWRLKLNKIFGDNSWYEKFYIPSQQIKLFDDDDEIMIKDVNTKELADYICERLKTIFVSAADNPRMLYNRNNSPLFLFCFAVSNPSPKAISAAMKGAKYILKNSGRKK